MRSSRTALSHPLAPAAALSLCIPISKGIRSAPGQCWGCSTSRPGPLSLAETLTFAVPMNKFDRMIDNMEESFLITPSWKKVRKRIAKA